MNKIFIICICNILVFFINNKLYSEPLVSYDYRACANYGRIACKKPEGTSISFTSNSFIEKKNLGWNIKAKETRSQCRDVKEVDRISCLVLNVVKICEKNPKLNYCDVIMNDPEGHISKDNWKHSDLEFKVVSESTDYLSQDNLTFYKNITISYDIYLDLEIIFKKIGDQYEFYKISYVRLDLQ
jgi:hypothetical protein